MKFNLAKGDNSTTIRIPKIILDELNIDSNNFENISFNIDIVGENLILKRSKKK